MPETTPQFAIDDKVRFISDRSLVGKVSAQLAPMGGEYFYRVALLSGRSLTCPEADLEPLREEASPEVLFRAGSFGDHEDLLRLVTFRKLDVPVENTIYSLGTTRTEFLPYQYKPLLKFTDSFKQRLLIADEVGLGKTIEAGLILVELKARGELGRALVVCPSALVYKWQQEMRRRFDEDFQVLSASEFRRLLTRMEEEGEFGEFRGIVSLQSLRQESIRDRLEAAPLHVDLLIVDEAHHCRNPETQSFRAVKALEEGALGMLLLTATPIHLGSENLFHLLRLLDPDEFSDVEIFQRQLAANRPIVEAERLLGSAFPPPRAEILECLERVMKGRDREYFLENPYFRRVRERIGRTPELSREDVAGLQHDLTEVNLLSHILTRTRKRDVQENPPARTPNTISVPITDGERDFYNAVTKFVRTAHLDKSGNVGGLAATTAQRQVASCIQAALPRFLGRAFDAQGDPDWSDLDDWATDLFDDDQTRTLTVPDRLIVAAGRLGAVDSKYDRFREVLEELERVEPGRKILLFAYFRDTLEYLARRLTEDGLRALMIHGGVDTIEGPDGVDDRSERLRRFKDDPEVQILLSSEVGSEGLDFQFAHVLINYDLPWNPMRVEQRIGRLDRHGQESDRIVIFNFTLEGTIEDRILRRLHDRIGIFRESIGDLEEILGNEIQSLQRDLLTRNLTPEEEERRIDQAAQAIERKKRYQESLEREGARLLGHDVYFIDRLERARSGGEYLAPSDLRAFFERFLESAYPEAYLKEARQAGVFTLHMGPQLETKVRAHPVRGSAFFRLLRRIRDTAGEPRVTFESSLAYRDDTLELLAPGHPLLDMALDDFRASPEKLFPTFSVRIGGDESVPSGTYALALYDVTSKAVRTRRRLELHARSLEDGRVLAEAERSHLLGRLLREGRRWEPDSELLGAPLDAIIDQVEAGAYAQFTADRVQLQERHESRIAAQRLSLDQSFERRIRQKGVLLQQAKFKGDAAPQYLRMLEGTIRNLEAERQHRAAEFAEAEQLHFRWALVGLGLAQVER